MDEDSLSILIVDDEPLAIRRLQNLCARLDTGLRIDTADGGKAALNAVAGKSYDALLLDIDMPGISGMEVANSLLLYPHIPQVIFTTAYKDFAVEAFRLKATDYLLKPVKQDDLREALDRVEDRIRARQDDNDPASEKRLWVQGYRGSVQISLSDIVRVEAEGDYMRLICSKGNYMLHMAMHKAEQLLPAQIFVRIHRSMIVRRGDIDETRREGRKYLVVMNDGQRFTVGPSYLKHIGAE